MVERLSPHPSIEGRGSCPMVAGGCRRIGVARVMAKVVVVDED
jgi:hypothetical protein